MAYHITTTVKVSFEEAVVLVTEALKKHGFGILTEIDVKETLKKKLDVEFRKYKILGACNPPLAHRALLAEDKVGTMLPCNVIIQESEEGKIEVSAINPIESMMAIKNEILREIAEQVTERLQSMISSL